MVHADSVQADSSEKVTVPEEWRIFHAAVADLRTQIRYFQARDIAEAVVDQRTLVLASVLRALESIPIPSTKSNDDRENEPEREEEE